MSVYTTFKGTLDSRVATAISTDSRAISVACFHSTWLARSRTRASFLFHENSPGRRSRSRRRRREDSCRFLTGDDATTPGNVRKIIGDRIIVMWSPVPSLANCKLKWNVVPRARARVSRLSSRAPRVYGLSVLINATSANAHIHMHLRVHAFLQ